MTEGAPRPRRVPERQCVACRTMAPRSGMIRVARTPAGEVVLDEGHRQAGRGAYVCRTPECARQATKRGAFNRALRRPIPADLPDRIIALAQAGDAPGIPTE